MKLGQTHILSAVQTLADNKVSDWAFIEPDPKASMDLEGLRSTQIHETPSLTYGRHTPRSTRLMAREGSNLARRRGEVLDKQTSGTARLA
jgi:hypothetical protein